MKTKRIILTSFLMLLSLTVAIVSCKKDKCKDQYCLNGAVCLEGICKCTSGFFGEHCESTKGFDCVSGNCVQSSGIGTYPSLVACQNACSPAGTNLTFVNNTFTGIDVTINGVTKIAPVGGSAVFTGVPGTSASGLASTSGKTSTGTQVGLLITWDLSYSYPSSGSTSVPLSVSSTYFFLKIKNNGSFVLNPVYVNYGLTSQTQDNIVLNADGQTYSIGYYKAFTNTNVRVYQQGTTTYYYWDQGNQFTFPWTSNQSVTLPIQ